MDMTDSYPATLPELIALRASHAPDHAAFIDGERVLTHAQYHWRCRALAAGLHRTGIQPGERIGLLAHNGLAFVELLGAAAQLGVAVSCLNWRLSAREVAQVVANDDLSIIFVSAALAPLLRDSVASSRQRLRIASLDERLNDFEHVSDFAANPELVPAVDVTVHTAAVLIHTAWTDGYPKAAVLTHGNLLAGARQLSSTWQLDSNDVHYCALPLFHITALTLALATLHAGGSSVLQARFNPEEALQVIEHHRVTLFGEFAPMLQNLIQQPQATSRLSHVRHVCGLDTPENIHEFESLCPRATFWSVYGQSEAGGVVTMAPFRDAVGSVGRALPHVEVGIVDDDGRSLPSGHLGEIVLRGPSVFSGYWNRPADTALALRDGWLHTGDAGRLDDQGLLFFAGRRPAKELIKTGGENVYPTEVEKTLREHPAVADAAIIGVPDPKWGESVLAICVLADDVTEQALIAFVGERIAHYKRPRAIVFTDALPCKTDGTHDREKIKRLFGN